MSTAAYNLSLSDTQAFLQAMVVDHPVVCKSWLVEQALALLAQDLAVGDVLADPASVKAFLRLQLGGLDHEVFGVLFLDTQHRVIEFQPMFRGTLNQTSVYPREVVKVALALNAAAVIVAHNHPSGHAEPSSADQHLTQTLKSALALVDVRVLDHMVVTAGAVTSFAERGLM